jgi:hypothetical protein
MASLQKSLVPGCHGTEDFHDEYNNHHHHVDIKELARSGLTHTEVSSMVFLGSSAFWGVVFFISLGNLLCGIRFTCFIHFLL